MDFSYVKKLQKRKADSVKSVIEQNLRRAFLELYRKYPTTEITVTQLCKYAHVARTTFYSHYQNVDELLEEIEDDLMIDLLAKASKFEGMHYNEKVLAFINEHIELLYLFLVARPNFRLTEKWKTITKSELYHFVREHTSEEETQYILNLISSLALANYTSLVENPRKYDLERVNRIMNDWMKTLLF